MKGFAIMILIYAALVHDLREGVVPNIVTIPAIFAGLFLSLFENGFNGLSSSFNAILYSFIISLILFRLGITGGGDGKLFIAGSSICGFPDCLKIFLLAFFSGFLYIFFDALLEGRFRKVLLSLSRFLRGKKSGEAIPFSPYIGIGILCTWGLK
mgnify:CR=1 FL=1